MSAWNEPCALRLAVYGAGGFGREVMPLVREAWPERAACFLETHPDAQRGLVNGLPLLAEDAFFALPCEQRQFIVAVANSRGRQILTERCLARGGEELSLISPRARVLDGVSLGSGAILCDHSMVTSNTRIGRSFQLNYYAYVAHDCVIGDYVTFGPRASCSGNVHIADHAYIGAGALIRQGQPGGRPLCIGEGAVVGMGAVVVDDVAPYTTVVGVPARPLDKRARAAASSPPPVAVLRAVG